MVLFAKAALLLLSVVSLSSGMLHRSTDHIQNRQSLLMFLDIMEESIIHEIRNYTATGYRSELFDSWTKALPYDAEMGRTEVEDYLPEQAIIGCAACRTYLASLIRDRQNGATAQQLANSAVSMCNLLTSFTGSVCRGVVDLNVEALVYIIDSRPSLTATNVCSLVLQGECGAVDPSLAFTVSVNPGSPITGPKSLSAPRASDELKIIHLTDIHYDEHYLAGSVAGGCPNPVCCRRADGAPSNPADGAGVWGDYRHCDTPWIAVEDTIRRVRNAHPNVDIIYYTGDIVDHGVWETTEAGNRRIMDRVFDLFKQYFPNTRIYPVLGNHEAQPTNVFAPSTISRPSLSTRWLYDYSATTWQRHGWLSGEALNTVRAGGYYTVLIQPGFRLIALNNNDCYIYNWWVMYSRTEIQAHLQWLHDTLLIAERNNERVHILAHIPSGGGSCFQFWSREYRRIVDRFHAIIGAQFNGHSHLDEFEVYYDSSSATHAVNVAWNGGGATAYHSVNPNYILYYVDRVHYQVNEYDSYIYSITEANASPSSNPRWFKQYSFKEAFGLANLSPASLDRLVFDLSRNRNLLRRYWQYKVKAGDPYIQAGCDDTCLRSHVCRIVVNEHNDNRRCNQVLAVFGTVA